MKRKDAVAFYVSLAVLVIDDFTGKPILGNAVRAYIPGQKAPIIKGDGYRVFINIDEDEVELVCEGAAYEKRVEKILLCDVEEVHIVRLMPNRSYPVVNGTTCVSGHCERAAGLLFWNKENKGYKLLGDYAASKQEQTINIYNPDRVSLEGKTFLIQSSQKKEFFRIVGNFEKEYRIDRRLSADYSRIGTVIIPVYEVGTDEWGDFFFPLSETGKEDITLVSRVGEKEAEWKLLRGKNNVIEL